MPATTQPPSRRQTGSLIPAGQEDRFKKSGSVGLTEHEFLNMQVDEGRMYVGPLPIMSGSEDRDGEITEPDGLFDGAYKLTRPVYFNHLHAFSPEAMPVGTCETPAHKYDLHRTADGWAGGTLFHDKTQLAEQTFALVVKGVIRGRSIGALDLDLDTYKPQVRRPVMVDGRIIPGKSIAKRHRQYEMVEFSWTAIPANAEIVTEMKSLLSRNLLEGRTLANEIKYTLKSLNLAAPRAGVSSAEKGRQNVYSDRFSKVFGKGIQMQGTPVAIQFDAALYTPDEALERLNAAPSAFVKNKRLEIDSYDGSTVLKAVQRPYRGEVEITTDARFPGVQLIFAKGGFFSQSEDTMEEDEEMPEDETQESDDQGSVVAQILEQAQGGDIAVAEKKAPAKGKPVAEKPVADGEMKKGAMPYGQEYLKAKMGHVTKLLEMSGEAMEGLEPEMVEKCGQWRRSLKAMADDIQAYENERYAPKDDAYGGPVKPSEKPAEDEDESPEGYDEEESEDAEDSEQESSEMPEEESSEQMDGEESKKDRFRKSANRKAFFGKHVAVPKRVAASKADSFLKSIFGGETEIPKPERDDIAQLVRGILRG